MTLFAAAAPPLGGFALVLAALAIVFAVIAIVRGIDVRLALLLAAFALAGLAGDATPVVRKFLATFSDERFVVPICSAMGFAYVLRQTQCDRHLVHLLTRPLRWGRQFLVPGVVFVGFFVNIPVISQSSTAVCLGAVVVPLMRAAGTSQVTIGASILLGSSLGGELLNPGAPELITVATRLSTPEHPINPQQVVPAVSRLVFYHLAMATAIFWLLSLRSERRLCGLAAGTDDPPGAFRVNYLRALVPLVPFSLLFTSGPPLNLFQAPPEWVVETTSISAYGTRLIGLAMLAGVVCAALAAPRQAAFVPRSFFEGAGYGFANVVSLIVTASCFGEAVKQIGLDQRLAQLVEAAPEMLLPMAAGVPLAFAALCGSGMAATQSLFGFFVTPAQSVGIDTVGLGAIVSIGAAAGRTLSPVAAVTLMCAAMTGTNPFALVKRIAIPLLVSWFLTVALRMLGVI